MIIGIDGNEANVKHKVGVSVYTIQMLNYFHSQASAQTQFIVYLRAKPQDELPKQTSFFTYKVVWGPLMWSQLFLPLSLWVSKLQGIKLHVFFSPAHYIPRNCPVKTVVTLHDLSYLYFPDEFLKKDLYQLKNWTEYAVQKSVKIIAVSKTTKKDIMHEYSIPERKIEVIYNGYENGFSQPNILPPTPYFLSIGTIQPRKNLSLLIRAFATFHSNHPEYKLIIAGKKGWLYEKIFDEVKQHHLNDAVQFPGYVSDTEKSALYSGAKAYILPSLYEGFGIPLLEAMAHSCPVISSFSSSLPEVGGEACLYFDPTRSEDLVEKMECIVNDTVLAKKLVNAGRKRIEAFSWEKAGRETLELLQTV